MSKQDMLKFQNNVLRVNIHCDGCKQKVKKTLQKIEGVYKVSIDVDQGKVTVTGNVDAATLIRKLEKSGKHAELWGAQKNSNAMNNQFKNMQMDNFKGQKDHKSQKGSGKDHQQKGGQLPSQQMMMPQKGGQQPSQQQMMMMQQMKNLNDFKGLQNGGQQPSQQQMMMMQQMKNMNDFRGPQNGGQQPSQQQMQMMMQQMKDFKGHPKDQKSVKFNMHEDESDNYDDDEDDDFDSEFDDEEDYDDEFDDDHAPLDKKMSGKKMNGHATNDYGKMMGGGGNGKHGPNKIMNGHGPNDVSKNGKKKGGGGMAGMLKNLKGIGGKKDDKEQKGGKNGKGVVQNQVDKKGGKNGGGMPGKGKGSKHEDLGGKGGKNMGKNAFDRKIDNGGFMMNKNPHGFQDINMNKKGGGGGGNMGPMGQQMRPLGNHPMEQMRNFQAVQGFPAGGNGGGYYQGMGQGPPHGNNPYNQQQQYMAQMMMNQQRGYGAPDMYQPMYAHPHPALMYGSPMAPPAENFSHMFNDENTSSCSIM